MAIVNVYVSLIKKGLKTLDDVPPSIRSAVVAELENTDNEDNDTIRNNNS